MAVFDLYSKRRKRLLGDVTDVFAYDVIPQGLREQILQIWSDAIGWPYVNPSNGNYADQLYSRYHQMVRVLRREYGVAQLAGGIRIDQNNSHHSINDLSLWFKSEQDADKVLDAIELSFRVIEKICGEPLYLGRHAAERISSEAIEELNTRFKEHGIGYQYTAGQVVRVDSHLIHTEAVIPALVVLHGREFANAQNEFLSAHEHFRHGKKQEALVDCCKCFESTMKVVCDKRGWAYNATKATAAELVKACFDHGLVPPYWQTHFGGLRSILESAISTPRNRQAGHGAGAGPAPEIPDELVSYVLHMTAATVLFLAKAEKSLRSV